MLARALATIMAAAALVVIGASTPASAGGDQNCWYETDPNTGEVKLVCEESDSGGGGNDDPGSGGSSTCSYAGDELPCTGPEGAVWSSEHTCYVVPTPVSPQSDPPAGQSDKDGNWHFCIQPPQYQGSNQNVWVETGEPLIDPVVLAQRAIATMDLDPIKVGIVPESGPNRVGLVGLPVWMWVDSPSDDTFGPITALASEGAVSVSATASVSGIVWDMGDGTKVTCTGKGTPYADTLRQKGLANLRTSLREDVDGPARRRLSGHRHEPLGCRVDRRRAVRHGRVRPDHRRGPDPHRRGPGADAVIVVDA